MSSSYRATAAGNLRSQCCAPVIYLSNILLPMINQQIVFSFDGTAITQIPVVSTDLESKGFRCSATDFSQTPWVLTDVGELLNLSFGSFVINQSLPTQVYTALVYANSLFAISYSGTVYKISGSSYSIIGSGFSFPVKDAVSNGTQIYAILDNSGTTELGELDTNTDIYSNVTVPNNISYQIAAFGSYPPAIIGASFAAFFNGIAAISPSPTTPQNTCVISLPTSNAIAFMTGQDPVWTIGTLVTGFSSPNALQYVPNGSQVLSTNGASLGVFTIVSGALTLSQTLTSSNAGPIAITPDSSDALIIQVGSNSVANFINTLGVWAAGTPITVSGAQCVIALSATSAAVGTATGISLLQRSGSTWSVSTTLSLGFSVIALEEVSGGTFVAVGNNGSTGYAVMVSGAAVLNTLSWTGNAESIVVTQGRAFVLDTTNNLIRGFSVVGSSILAEFNTSVISTPYAPTSLAFTGVTLWQINGLAAYQSQINKPFNISPIYSGDVSVYNGSWIQYTFGIGHQPTAVTYDTSGNLYVATLQNDLYKFGPISGGFLPLISQSVIPEFSGQKAGTSLSISSLVFVGIHLYGSSSSSGVLTEIL